MKSAIAAFTASLALAGTITGATVRAASAAPAPAVLTAIHVLTDAAVVQTAALDYGLPVTAANCTGTGPVDPDGITDPGIACRLTGPNGWQAWGTGVIFPTGAPVGAYVNVGMVFWPVVDGRIDGRI